MSIAANQVREFRLRSGHFVRRTRRRVTREITILLGLAVFFWSDWSNGLPSWLELSVLVCFTSYVAVGLAYYRRDRRFAEKYAVCPLETTLGFQHEGQLRQVPYSELKISKVKKRNGEVVEIHLKTKYLKLFGTIKLSGLENMDELYGLLAERVKKG